MSRGWKYILEPLYTVHYHSGMLNMQFRNNTRFGPKMLQKLSEEGGKPSKPITFILLHRLLSMLGKLCSLRLFSTRYFYLIPFLLYHLTQLTKQVRKCSELIKQQKCNRF